MLRPRPLHVLLVDDDETTLAVLTAALEGGGHRVTCRTAALGTTLAIARDRPDVVVLDVRMPGLSGDRLARLIAGQGGGNHPFVILHSSLPQTELDAVLPGSGADAAIEKSAEPDRFLRRFQEVLPLSLRRQRSVG